MPNYILCLIYAVSLPVASSIRTSFLRRTFFPLNVALFRVRLRCTRRRDTKEHHERRATRQCFLIIPEIIVLTCIIFLPFSLRIHRRCPLCIQDPLFAVHTGLTVARPKIHKMMCTRCTNINNSRGRPFIPRILFDFRFATIHENCTAVRCHSVLAEE